MDWIEQQYEAKRRRSIAGAVEHIERAKVLRDYAAENNDWSDIERQKLDKEIIDLRRVIVNELTSEELRDLKTQKLNPEDAMRIIRDPVSVLPEDRVLKSALARMYAEQIGHRSVFVAEKGYAIPLGIAAAATELERRGAITKLKLPSTTSIPMASIADAALNHRPDRNRS